MVKRSKAEKKESPQTKSKSTGASGRNDGDRTDQASETGTLDAHYNLVSVLYHALQGASLYTEFAEDAEREGDAELGEFFRELQGEERDRAERAKGYLVERLVGSSTGEGEDDDDEEAANASV